jgi:hypothetical protein
MKKQFYQCDVAESDTDSIWTGSIYYVETLEEAEFLTMLELQQDWGDGYMPDNFLDVFGGEPVEGEVKSRVDDPQFPGAEAWNAAGYWDDAFKYSEVIAGMLMLPPLEALAKLDKITFDVPDDVVAAVMRDEARLHVVVDMSEPTHVPGLNEALAPKGGE